MILRECKSEIRKALDGVEGAPSIKEVSDIYGDALFKAETIVGWITEETTKRSEQYLLLQDLKKATALLLDKAKGDDTQLAKLEKVFKDELAQIRALAAQQRAEKETREKAATLTAHQRRILSSAAPGEDAREVTDDDF
jgi:predicted metal-dependent enzyme (double-stranded beta helix superfamily)